jgi:hypothetical protein
VPHLGGFVIVRFESPTAAIAQWRPVLGRLLDRLTLLPEHAVVFVRTAAPGLTADEVNASVTAPLEPRLADLPDLVSIRCASRRGESVVELTLPSHPDLPARRQEVRQRVEEVRKQFPPQARIELEPSVAADGPTLLIALYADEPNPPAERSAELEALAEQAVRGRLSAVPGVADIRRVGAGRRLEDAPSVERLNVNGMGPSAPPVVLLSLRVLVDADPGAVCRAAEQILSDVAATLPEHVKLLHHAFGPNDFGLTMHADDNETAFAATVEKVAANVARIPGVKSVWRVDSLGDRREAHWWIALDTADRDRREQTLKNIRSQAKAAAPTNEIRVSRPDALVLSFDRDDTVELKQIPQNGSN